MYTKYYQLTHKNSERGMVTSEFAFALLGFAAIFSLIFTFLYVVRCQIHLDQETVLVARALSWGTSEEEASRLLASRIEGSQLTVEMNNNIAYVKTSIPAPVPLISSRLESDIAIWIEQ